MLIQIEHSFLPLEYFRDWYRGQKWWVTFGYLGRYYWVSRGVRLLVGSRAYIYEFV